jgi:hypothetical protein
MVLYNLNLTRRPEIIFLYFHIIYSYIDYQRGVDLVQL